MLRKISLAALFCFSPIVMSESATAGHGCHHAGAVATAYRAPLGHSHASHRHHHAHHGHRAHHYAAPQAACCGAASSIAYRPAASYSRFPQAAAYGGYRPPSPRYPRSYGGATGAFRGGNPFAGARLDLRIDRPRYGY